MIVSVVALGFGGLQAVRAATGGAVPDNWLGFTLIGCTVALVFPGFLTFYDRSYRVCWGDDALRVRLPGLSWRLGLQEDIVVPVKSITAVTPEDGPVMPALRNVLVWYSAAGGSANVPLSPVLLVRAEFEQILVWINERSGVSVDHALVPSSVRGSD